MKEKPVYIIALVLLAILALAIVIVLLIRIKEEQVDIDRPITPGVKEIQLIKQPLEYYKNYQINVPIRIISEIDRIANLKYSGFEIKDIDHVSWAEAFLSGVGKGNLPRQEVSPEGNDWSGQTIYTWENPESFVIYEESKDTLFFRFNNPVNITGINLKPSDEAAILRDIENISNKFFSNDFLYAIDDIYRHGNDYKIEYSRTLNGIPVYPMEQRPYLLVTPDGRLREGLFLLVEFEENLDITYPLISGDVLEKNINTVKYPKHIKFELLKESSQPFAYGDPFLNIPFSQNGTIEANDMEVVYPYMNKSISASVPTFLFRGPGVLDLEGGAKDANFTVLVSAIEFKYVYIHPDSHFEMLENIE